MEPFTIENIRYAPSYYCYMNYQVGIIGFEEGITQVVIPELVTHNGITFDVICVHKGSFKNCHSLQSITLPDTLILVEEFSFQNCKNLENVTYTGDIRIFQKNAFKGCPKLQDDQGLVIFHQIVIDYFGNNQEIIIPEGVTEINRYAFFKNTKLISVTFPSTLRKISFAAFSYCAKLREVHLPSNVLRLESRAFALCKGLEKVVLPEHFTKIEKETFARCTQLKEINFSEKLKVIHEEAFIYCSSLTKIHFPKHLNIIKKKAFCHCNHLQELRFPESLQEIETHGFKGCDGLETVVFDHKLEDKADIKIPKNSFSYTPNGLHISDLVLKAWSQEDREKLRFRQLCHWEELWEDEKSVFFKDWRSKREKNPLRHMVFQKGTAKELSIYFQEGFHLSLEELDDVLADTIACGETSKTAVLLEYKNNQFTKENTEQYETEKELLEIGLQLPSLKQFKKKWKATATENYLTISGYKGKSKEELMPEVINTGKPIKYVASAVFFAFLEENYYYRYSCSPYYRGYILQSPKSFAPLERLTFPNGDEIFISENIKDSRIQEFYFPTDCKIIPDEFLYNCRHIKKVVLSATVGLIGRNAFRDCVGLEEVVLSENLTFLEVSCFQGCENLKFIDLSENLKEIDDYAFRDCHSLEEIILPDSLCRLGSKVFSCCSNLKKVILSENTKIFYPDTFVGCPRLEFIGYGDGVNLIEKLLSGDFNKEK